MTTDLHELKRQIDKLSPPDQLRLAANLIERGQLQTAETICSNVANALAFVRLTSKENT